MLRRSDFIDARYAFSFVFANFGIAIAARMPMITTTIRSSMRVKPFLFCMTCCSVERGLSALQQRPTGPKVGHAGPERDERPRQHDTGGWRPTSPPARTLQ